MPARRYYKKLLNNNIEFLIDELNDRVYKASYILNKEGNKNVLLIGRAPKCYDWYSCDKILERAIKYLYKQENYFDDIRKISIVNLFVAVDYGYDYIRNLINGSSRGFVEGNDSRFKKDGEIIKNDDIIIKSIKECDDILLAWGEPIRNMERIYEERIEFVLREIRKERLNSDRKLRVYKIGEESTKGFPKHPLAWSYRDELVECF